MGSFANLSRVRWQCRRGMLELDVILQRFYDARYHQLSESLQQSFSVLLQQDDPLLYDWLIAEIPCNDTLLQPVIDLVKSG